MSALASLKNGKYKNDTLSKNQIRHITGGATVTQTGKGSYPLPDGTNYDYIGDVKSGDNIRYVGTSWESMDVYLRSAEHKAWLDGLK